MPTFKVKLSDDGAALSRNSNLFVFSFSLLPDKEKVMSSTAIKVPEEYEALRIALGNIRTEVNNLITKGFLEIGDRTVKVEFFLWGDYKFLLLALGMKSATCHNSCILCKVHINERSDLSKPLNYFQTVQMKRRIDNTWASDPGCKGQPLFSVPLENVLIDELHLLLRITDRLEHDIILEVIG